MFAILHSMTIYAGGVALPMYVFGPSPILCASALLLLLRDPSVTMGSQFVWSWELLDAGGYEVRASAMNDLHPDFEHRDEREVSMLRSVKRRLDAGLEVTITVQYFESHERDVVTITMGNDGKLRGMVNAMEVHKGKGKGAG